jgi:formylmethanofuran dehydrogenase subunit C
VLVLKYKLATTVPVEVDGLAPQRVRGKSLAEIAVMPAWNGNRAVSVGELFDLSGDPADARMLFEGDLAGVHRIASGMTEGEVRIAGSAGRHAGSEMRGGLLTIEGDAGDWLGAQMHGGQIHVRGRAGGQVGAAYRGSRRGMTGGTILVEGDAGDEVGLCMRRGLIAIGGAAGDGMGFNLIAGTILAFGRAGLRPGAGMKRGTIGLFGPGSPELLPTFKFACRYRPQFLGLYFGELARLGFRVPTELLRRECLRYCGDLAETGKGEILLAAR